MRIRSLAFAATPCSFVRSQVSLPATFAHSYARTGKNDPIFMGEAVKIILENRRRIKASGGVSPPILLRFRKQNQGADAPRSPNLRVDCRDCRALQSLPWRSCRYA